MTRPLLDEAHVHPSLRDRVGGADPALAEVQKAIATHDVVVVGMRQDPHGAPRGCP